MKKGALTIMSYRFKQFIPYPQIGAFDISPNGKKIIYVTYESDRCQLWKQAIQQVKNPVQLASLASKRVRLIAWPPGGARVFLLADERGDEIYQIYSMSTSGGNLEKVTTEPNVRNEFSPAGFSPDRKFIAYARNALRSRDIDICLQNLETGEKRILVKGKGDYLYFPFNFSPNGRYLSIIRSLPSINTHILVYDLRTNTCRNVTQCLGESTYFPGPWDQKSRGFYVLTNQSSEFFGLGFYDINIGRFSWLEQYDCDIESVDLTRDGRYLGWINNKLGTSCLVIHDLVQDTLLTFPKLPSGVISSAHFSSDGEHLVFYLENTNCSRNLYALGLTHRNCWRLSQSTVKVPSKELVEPELINYSSFDRNIPAWLYKPRNLKPGERVPVVLSIHGGPESQERPIYAYDGLYQYLLHRGIGILAPNIRGSTGYGKSYQRLIYRDWGGGELKDVIAGTEYLRRLDWVDSERLGIFGISFGGFVALSAVTRFPHYWSAAVDIMGPSDLVTFTQRVPPFWRGFMKNWVGDPDKDHDFLVERSPITYVHQLCCPILIIQGEHDVRVRRSESDQIVEKLKAQGRDVEYIVFEGEGHGFTNPINAHKAWQSVANFFEKHLKRTT